MSSNESSGAAAEADRNATPAPSGEFPTFGSTRGSGLARGKRPAPAASTASAAPASDYKPTAIEVVNAPREYTNPFAPATPEPTETPAPAASIPETPAAAPVAAAPAPVAAVLPPPAPVAEPETPAQLNILPPAEQKSTPAQTWESDGFSGEREAPSERPSRHSDESEEVDISTIPAKFLYVRPGVKFVPTPRNWGGAPRERHPRAGGDESPRHAPKPAAAPAAEAPKSGGILGWFKGLFGSKPAEQPAAASSSPASEPRREGGHRRHRGGRGHGGPEGGDGQRRRRGGRGRGRSGGGGDIATT